MFRLEVGPINTVVTSKEAILQACRQIVAENGLSALNMRSVAQACHVALGSLYNYFPSKEDLLIATIESVWQDIFHTEHPCPADTTFAAYVQWMFEHIQCGVQAYPNFFTAHSLSLASTSKHRGRDTMTHLFSHIKLGMAQVLGSDKTVRADAFSDSFPQSAFLDWILTNILVLLVEQKTDCGILCEIIRRTLYPRPVHSVASPSSDACSNDGFSDTSITLPLK